MFVVYIQTHPSMSSGYVCHGTNVSGYHLYGGGSFKSTPLGIFIEALTLFCVCPRRRGCATAGLLLSAACSVRWYLLSPWGVTPSQVQMSAYLMFQKKTFN